MAIQMTQHTRDHGEPAQSDFDQNELSDKVGEGYDGQEFQELKDAQTAGSRNERVTNYKYSEGYPGARYYGGNEHNVEPTTSAEFQTGNRPKPSADAAGISNHSMSEETKQQERVAGVRPDAVGPVDPQE